MSAILAVCGDAFCAMVSDGRYVEEPITGDKPHIISDELPKVRKVNRNVLVGFAGDTLAAVQIINALDQYDVRYLTLEKVVKILCEKAPAVTTQPARQGAYLIEGAASHTEIAPWLEREVKPDAPNWRSLDDVAHPLDACIAKMAEDDKSINTHYFRQLVM